MSHNCALIPKSQFMEYFMTLLTRYLLESGVESEVNNDLMSSLLGSDSISGLFKWRRMLSPGVQAIARPTVDISCYLGVMSAVKESDSRSAKRFPSQQNPMGSVK